MLDTSTQARDIFINVLNAELNPIRHLLALVGVHHILHVSRVRVNAYGLSCKVSVNFFFFKFFTQIEMTLQYLLKFANIEFYRYLFNSSSICCLHTDGRTG
jgi:hypothetical protein